MRNQRQKTPSRSDCEVVEVKHLDSRRREGHHSRKRAFERRRRLRAKMSAMFGTPHVLRRPKTQVQESRGEGEGSRWRNEPAPWRVFGVVYSTGMSV